MTREGFPVRPRFAVCVFGLLAVALPGCTGYAGKLVGTWRSAEEKAPVVSYFRFHANSTFEFLAQPPLLMPGQVPAVNTSGTYSIEIDVVTLNAPGMPPNMTRLKIAATTDDTLVFQTVTGPMTVFSYKRMAR